MTAVVAYGVVVKWSDGSRDIEVGGSEEFFEKNYSELVYDPELRDLHPESQYERIFSYEGHDLNNGNPYWDMEEFLDELARVHDLVVHKVCDIYEGWVLTANNGCEREFGDIPGCFELPTEGKREALIQAAKECGVQNPNPQMLIFSVES